ncbi:hypothetical protein [Bifidobacterium pseudolongum]|nr:hypothetical protein [Bifidobacterium pseudolongum]
MEAMTGDGRKPWVAWVVAFCVLAVLYLAGWFAAKAYVDREVDTYLSAQRIWVASEGMVNDTNRLITRLPSDLRKQAQEETPVRPPVARTANAYLESPHRSPYIWVLIHDARTIRHEWDTELHTALQNLDHNTQQYDALNAD